MLFINDLPNATELLIFLFADKYMIIHSRGKKLDFDENSIVYNENEIGKPQNPDLITPLREFMTCTPKRTVEPTSFWVCILMRQYPFNIMLTPSVTNSLALFFASTELNISWILNH